MNADQWALKLVALLLMEIYARDVRIKALENQCEVLAEACDKYLNEAKQAKENRVTSLRAVK